MIYQFLEREEFQIIGLKRTYNCQSGEHIQGIPQFWHDAKEDGTINRLVDLNNGALKGVVGVCIFEENNKDLMDYWIATAYNGEVTNRFLSYEIPASKWVTFEVHGPLPKAIQDMWKNIYSEWFPTNTYKPTGDPLLEVYTNENTTEKNYYSEIWIPIK